MIDQGRAPGGRALGPLRAGGFLRALAAVRVGVVLSGFLSLALVGELGPLAASVALVAALGSGWQGRDRGSPALWLRVQVAFLVWLGFGYGVQGVHSLSLLAQLLWFVQVHRLWTRKSSRDDLYLCFIAFAQVLLASILTIHVAFLFVFMAFAVTSCWCLMLNRLVAAVEEDWRQRHGPGGVPMGRFRLLDPLARWPLFVSVAALGFTLLVGTIALFFALPRMQASMFASSFLPSVHVSGFAERVRLGELGAIKLSDAPVFRAEVADSAAQPVDASQFYWHGLALDQFDGRAWELSQPERTILHSQSAVGFLGPPPGRSWALRQEIQLEPLDSRVLFHLSTPVGIYGSFRSLETVAGDGYYLPGALSNKRPKYTVYSAVTAREPAALRRQDPRDSPPGLVARQTALPGNLAPRIPQIAKDWTRGAGSPLDSILMIQRRLRNDYVYSLDQLASASSDPLLSFLDDVKEGHCEYYASSMAVLLRTLGIPARLVNGFYGGTWNPIGRYWLVRQLDAHSWVEVHFPEAGWVVFDPTPESTVGLQDRIDLRLLDRLRAWADYGTVVWRNVLLDYGLGTQVALLQRGVSRLVGDDNSSWFGGWGQRYERRDRSEPLGEDAGLQGWAWLAVLALIGLCVGGVLVVRGARRGAVMGPELAQALKLLERTQRDWLRLSENRARQQGAPAPKDGAPFMAWAAWAEEQEPVLFGDARDLVARYYAARFGREPLDDDALVGLRSLRRAARRGRATRS